MSVQSTDPEPKVDYSTMTLDALRRLAEHGPDAATRAGARRELEGRVAPAGETLVTYTVSVGKSEYTTPRPRIVASVRGVRGHRHVAAALHDLAAELERVLADTPEQWRVGVQVYEFADDVGEVHLELMTGSPAEVQRAVSVLERVAGQTATTGRTSGRRPGKPRRVADVAAVPDTAVVVAGSTETVAAAPAIVHLEVADRVSAAPGVADESESRSRRRKRQRYREAAGHAADSFEREQLADDPAMIPACARTVIAGGAKSTEYWQWLLERWDAVQQTEPTRREVAS